jgi:hypothetical protein
VSGLVQLRVPDIVRAPVPDLVPLPVQAPVPLLVPSRVPLRVAIPAQAPVYFRALALALLQQALALAHRPKLRRVPRPVLPEVPPQALIPALRLVNHRVRLRPQ